MKQFNITCAVLAFTGILTSTQGMAGWQDMLNSAKDMAQEQPAGQPAKQPAEQPSAKPAEKSAASFTQQEAGDGLQQALVKGVERVVGQLGAAGGYLNDPKVKIPLPGQLKTVESGLRMMGQEAYADQFVKTMNQAAEQAVGEAKPVFVDAIQNMSFEDASSIVQGGNDAATQYLQKTTGPALRERMLPIVKNATESAQVTSAYKALVDKAGGMAGGMIDMKTTDLDGYVTDKALDGLYKLLAEQEAGIRSNPTEWTTGVLKKVFGGL